MTSPRPVHGFHLVEVHDADSVLLLPFYRQLLAENFEAAQLVSEEEFVTGHRDGAGRTVLAIDEGQSILGGLSAQWYSTCRVLLLGYLAVDPRVRGAGIGADLVRHAVGRWSREFDPLLVLGEVEDPRHHGVNRFGDPQQRFRFYHRFDARALRLPYFQPALGPGGSRVPGFLLMVFAAAEQAWTGAGTVDGALLERFLRHYLAECEGPWSDGDTGVDRLLVACRAPGGVPLLPVGALPT